MSNYKTILNTKTSLGALVIHGATSCITRAEKSYITRVPSLHYRAINTRSKNNETLIYMYQDEWAHTMPMDPKSILRLMRTLGPSPASLAQSS